MSSAFRPRSPLTAIFPVVLVCLLLVLFTACGGSDESDPAPDGDTDVPADGDTDGDDSDGDSDGDADGETEEAAPALWPPYDYCEADTPPDESCFQSKRDPQSDYLELARAIADKAIAARNPDDIRWDWTETVLMLGIDAVYRLTGDAKYQAFYKTWMDHHIAEGYTIGSSDTCAPAAVALRLLIETSDTTYAPVLEEALHYLYEVATRTEEGGINHLGTFDALGISLWVDSLFMFGNVLTGWGAYDDDLAALDEYAFQYRVFTDLLQESLGFYKHGYNSTFEQDDDVYWARGNAWIVAAGADHLRVRRNRGERLLDMEAAYRRLIAAFVEHQDASGLWWTVLNRPGETYLETSATALFAFGSARAWRYGYLDDDALPPIRQAMAGVLSKIVTDGEGVPTVTDISGPTNIGTFEVYANVPLHDDLSYGLGAVLLALIETSGLPQE